MEHNESIGPRQVTVVQKTESGTKALNQEFKSNKSSFITCHFYCKDIPLRARQMTASVWGYKI